MRRNKGYWKHHWRKVFNNQPQNKNKVVENRVNDIEMKMNQDDMCNYLILLIICRFPYLAMIFMKANFIYQMLPKEDVERKVNPIKNKSQTKTQAPGEMPIVERHLNLLNQKPNRVISGISVGRKYNYRAYVFGDRAIVENIGYGNAAFCMKCDENDYWLNDLEQNKSGIKKSPWFKKKINHFGEWRIRILDFLTDPCI